MVGGLPIATSAPFSGVPLAEAVAVASSDSDEAWELWLPQAAAKSETAVNIASKTRRSIVSNLHKGVAQ